MGSSQFGLFLYFPKVDQSGFSGLAVIHTNKTWKDKPYQKVMGAKNVMWLSKASVFWVVLLEPAHQSLCTGLIRSLESGSDDRASL